MTVPNHIAAVATVVVAAYLTHIWWTDIRYSLCLLLPKSLVEAACLGKSH